VGERVLVAYRDPTGGYELLRSHWAETDRLVAAAVENRCPDRSASDGWYRCGHADWTAVVDRLDYLSLALCLRCEPTSVRVYLPVWLGIPTGDSDETESTCGALLRVASQADLARLRTRLRQRKARLGTAVKRNRLGVRDAQKRLLAVAGTRERHLSRCARGLSDPE
jgi:hypothetical protein